MKKSRLLGLVSACLLALLASTLHAVVMPLESRLGGLAYYDPNLDITWAADASLSGQDTWDNQMAWVTGLTIGGVGGWRLPSADVNGNGSVADCTTGLSDICSDNEMDYLFSVEGIGASSPGPFNIPFNPNSASYSWSGTEYDFDEAWDFEFNNGNQGIGNKSADDYAWAVHNGDVGAIPMPAALYLFGSGLLGLIGIARKKWPNISKC